MTTAIVWFRRDLRVHDHPALVSALKSCDEVVPVFVIDPRLIDGRFASGARTAFMLDCLRELDGELRHRGARLVVREGDPRGELVSLAREVGAQAVHWASDVSPFARARDDAVMRELERSGVRPVPGPGNFVADVNQARTAAGNGFTVFSPFHRAWLELDRRTVHRAPPAIPFPRDISSAPIPTVEALGLRQEVAEPLQAGEAAGRRRVAWWLSGPIDQYSDQQDRFARGSSMLSPYLHFGCVSARELEARVAARPGRGAAAFRRQLAWRDFYAHVLLRHPANARHEFQERYADLRWDDDEEALAAWREGRTGYPLVDAGMRQLAATGWMHNRARLVVGSFLTKDLHLDWRLGEAHFMRLLLDGDEASNNGNWQWIASVGVDPAPYFRRMFNPALQQRRFDPSGEYVRRWCPELARVPDERLPEPWTMTPEQQRAAGCVIGRDYPEPIVDHREERRRAIERYRAAG